jgi:hypothetical protein
MNKKAFLITSATVAVALVVFLSLAFRWNSVKKPIIEKDVQEESAEPERAKWPEEGKEYFFVNTYKVTHQRGKFPFVDTKSDRIDRKFMKRDIPKSN